MPPRHCFALIGTSLLLLSACQKQEIKSYRVAKDKATPPASMQAMPSDHPAMGAMPADHPPVGASTMQDQGPALEQTGAAGELVWSAPTEWVTKPLGQMRKGSYGIKGDNGQEADLSIFVFPGAAGGTLDNINRWRGQISLPPLSQAQLADETTPLASNTGLEMLFVDMTGKGNERILGALLIQGSQSWFFKLKGPTAVLEKEKAAFISFLKTVKTR